MRTADVKDQIELSGNDIQAVSMTGERVEEWRYIDTFFAFANKEVRGKTF